MEPWVADTHGWIHLPDSDADWTALLERYQAGAKDPLARVFAVARANRCLTVFEENRYVDPDFRSEYSEFWSRRFAGTPAFTRRLHFFRRRLDEWGLHRLPGRPGYLGYAVLKPIGAPSGNGRVGRTMLVPPPRLKKATMALATDQVSLFGQELTVEGFPFYEQDGEFLRCAHVASWMCHYHAHLRKRVGRQVTARLASLSPPGMSEERDLPSPGLTLSQIQAIFAETGQPALFYGLRKMPDVEGVAVPPTDDDRHPGYWDTRVFGVICRYINAGFPVMVGSENHAFVIFGWYRRGARIHFVACDDQWGPYQIVNSPFNDSRAPWQCLMVPLPPKVYLTAESAENAAHTVIQATGARRGALTEWVDLAKRLTSKEVSLRTFLRSNHEYKNALGRQGRGDDARRVLSLARLPHWVWVVEAHDRSRRSCGKPSVLAELVFDSTSNDTEPVQSALSIPDLVTAFSPEGGESISVNGPREPWKSQLSAAG